jgi:hypothetical protein
MRSVFLTVLVLLALTAVAADPVVTRIDFRFISKDAAPGSFQASTRKMWRAGDTYMRVEEEPDPKNHIDGVTITHEPDSWLWNRYNNVARHIVDTGPTFNVSAPVFPGSKSEELEKLQMGRELAFFHAHRAQHLPDQRVDGVALSVQSLTLDGYQVKLLVRKDDGNPWQLELATPKESEVIRYDAFQEGLPFDRQLFELPARVKVIEAK